MSERPKLETVAREAGVSTTTASQVMRGTGRISDTTRKRVLSIAEQLRYVPDGRAASMRSRESKEIGLVLHQLSNPFNAEIISGVSDLLESEGYLVSVLDARSETKTQDRHLESFIRNGRGGLIWVPAMKTPMRTIKLLKTHDIPVVTFLRSSRCGSFDHVGIRNEQATETATEYLLSLGHKKIGYFGGTEMTAVRQERIAGCKTALEKAGLDLPVIWDSADSKIAGLDAMMALREAHPEITAIVCNGDMVALGACLALARRGETAGKDISVIGFDDIPDAVLATPALSTMSVSPYKLGRRLARSLLERIRDAKAPIAVTEFSAELVIRETTGGPPEGVPKHN